MADLKYHKIGTFKDKLLDLQIQNICQWMRNMFFTPVFSPNLPIYANNAAALAGGLTAGQVYRTATGQMMITYDV